jgi:BRCA1-associated protein
VCNADQNLWICIICGNVGCGRYDSAHAFAHYEATKHSFAMDIATQHVWDYAGDGYVHRLIQSKADGKLMDLPAAAWSDKGKIDDGGMSAMGADTVPREKMEAMSNEYTYMLTSQLESQRLYYEEQLDRAVTKASKAASSAEGTSDKLDSVLKELKELQVSHSEAKQSIRNLEKEVERSKKRSEKADALARKLGSDWKEEKTVNESLMQRIKFLNEQVKEAEAKQEKLENDKKDLEEQNRDLSFFISTSQKLKDADEEIVEGTLEVGAAPESSEAGGGKKKRKGKKR